MNEVHNAQYALIDAIETVAPVPVAVPYPDMPDSGLRLINQHAVDHLTEHTMRFVAELVAALINAGSEREAVLENDQLRAAIRSELHAWSNHSDNAPQQ